MQSDKGIAPRLARERAAAYVSRFPSVAVAVLGDVMLDRYFWGDVERISPEAPVPVVRVTRRSARPGGAANVAANLRALGVGVHIAGTAGNDRTGEDLRRLLADQQIHSDALLEVPGTETTEKVRIIARNQQVVRADFESDARTDTESRSQLVDRLASLRDRCDALVVSDYGKGVIQEDMLREVIAAWRHAGKPVLVDPHVPHFNWYRGATVVTPNAREASAATGLEFTHGESPREDAFRVVRDLELGALLVTRGEEGMSLYSGDSHEVHVPTVAKEVYDVTGAGDTVIGVLAASLAAGADLVESMVLSNRAAGEVVKEVGTSTITAEMLLNTVD